nr:hypothetical protein Iba_chr13bCG6650 [Ipomoea batatas]
MGYHFFNCTPLLLSSHTYSPAKTCNLFPPPSLPLPSPNQFLLTKHYGCISSPSFLHFFLYIFRGKNLSRCESFHNSKRVQRNDLAGGDPGG